MSNSKVNSLMCFALMYICHLQFETVLQSNIADHGHDLSNSIAAKSSSECGSVYAEAS